MKDMVEKTNKEKETAAASPANQGQGSGKGPVEAWVAVVRPGRVVYEISGVPEETAREAMRLAAHKLPIPTRFVARVEL